MRGVENRRIRLPLQAQELPAKDVREPVPVMVRNHGGQKTVQCQVNTVAPPNRVCQCGGVAS